MDKTNECGRLSGMETVSPLDLLTALLRGPCRVTKVSAEKFSAGRRTSDEVIVTHRLILIVSGGMDYTVEGRTQRLGDGLVLWVPAWCRREWRVPARGRCELAWCEFATDPVATPPVLMVAKKWGMEPAATLARMAALWPAKDRADALRLEAEAKRLAAEFWTRAEASAAPKDAREERHPEVRRAVAWLEANHARPDALELFYRELELSPNHFRLLFRTETGETVQAMLMRLRMRRARYLAVETTRPMKAIAAECGFDDPLYFSASYRRFWGRSPSVDRGARRAEA